MCLNPVSLTAEDGSTRTVPCGHCIQCLKNYQDQWAARLNAELDSWKPVVGNGFNEKPAVFFTLSYRDDSIPKKYLVLTTAGYVVSYVRPDCPVDECWTSLTRESSQAWMIRKSEILARWKVYNQFLSDPYGSGLMDLPVKDAVSLYELVSNRAYKISSAFASVVFGRPDNPTLSEFVDKNFITYGQNTLVPRFGCPQVRKLDFYNPYLVASLNPSSGSFVRVPDNLIYRKISDFETNYLLSYGCPCSYGRELSLEDFDEFVSDGLSEDLRPIPLYAVEFNSVCKSDVQLWLKRGRINFERKFGDSVIVDGVNKRFISTWIDHNGFENSLPACVVPRTLKYFITSEYGPKTQRPHYHGVMFGLTYDEFEKCFASDARSKFGDIKFEILQASSGGCTYVAKYCAKGFYEHEYCRKDFFYPASCKSYHADYFVRVAEDFNINGDLPLVDPTFHICSKGLGGSYAFKQEVQDSFCTYIEEEFTLFNSDGRGLPRRFVANDGPRLRLSFPSYGLDEYLGLKKVWFYEAEDGSILIRTVDKNYNVLGESVVYPKDVLNQLSDSLGVNLHFEDSLLNTFMVRNYVKGKVRKLSYLGSCSIEQAKTGSYSIPLPRYYHHWLLSPMAELLRKAALHRKPVPSSEVFSRAFQHAGPTDTLVRQFCNYVHSSEEIEKITYQKFRKFADRFYSGTDSINNID